MQQKYDALQVSSSQTQAKTANLEMLLNLKNQQLAKLGDDYGKAVSDGQARERTLATKQQELEKATLDLNLTKQTNV